MSRPRALLCDLLTGLLDSWSLWDDVAGGREPGRRWRARYLELTYGQGDYVPYETLVARAAADSGLDSTVADALVARWAELQPWPEAPEVLTALAATHRLAVVTNCSVDLGRRAAARVGVPFDVVVTAEEARAFKPDPRAYQAALDALALSPSEVLFLAGSPGDVTGATAMGMPVVWHNRAGLPPAGVAPREEIRDLRDLRV